MKKKIEMKKYILSIIVFIVGVATGMLLPRLCPFLQPQAETITRADTLTVRDTTKDRKPGVAKVTADSMRLLKVPSLPDLPDIAFVSDTMYIRDTVYVPVRWVQHKYDRPDYQAWVSGYQIGSRGPQLDSIRVYPETRYVTRETIFASPRKCNSIALESSASWCGTWSLTCSLEYDYVFKWCYLGAGVGYDIVTRSPYIAVRAGVPIWSW